MDNTYRRILQRIAASTLSIFLLSAFIQGQELPTIALIDFDAGEGGGISQPEMAALMNRLLSNIVNLNIYTVLDRSSRDDILKEHGYILSGCTSDECAVEVGQLLSAQLMLSGNITRFGNYYAIEARVNDVETGTVSKSVSHNVTGDFQVLLNEGMDELAKRLAPGLLIAGEIGAVISINGETLGSLPLPKMYYPLGEYELTAVKPEYYPYRTLVILTGREETTIQVRLRAKPKLPALVFSTAIPGTGQIYQGYRNKGFFYLVATAGMCALTYISNQALLNAYDEYQDTLADYNGEPDPALWIEKRDAVRVSFDKATTAENRRNIAAGVLGAVWLVNIISVTF